MTRRILLPALALIALLGAAHAQGGDEYQKKFNEGIAALSSGDHQKGIDCFLRCIELSPKDSVSAYNVACGYSLMENLDPAFEWLDKAADWGFGNISGNIPHAKQDGDLANLRSDPRFEAFIAKMERLEAERKVFLESIEGYWSKPEIYVPEAVRALKAKPLLVVLHDHGATKEGLARGRWRKIADELGMALMAPSGKIPIGAKVEDGMTWFDNRDEYLQRYWTFEKHVNKGVSAFKKEHELDKERVYIAGEGLGAVVAFNVGVAAPRLYKGVVMLDSVPLLELAQPRAAVAAEAGFQAHLLFDSSSELGLRVGDQLGAQCKLLGGQLDALAIRNSVTIFEPDPESPEALSGALLVALRKLEPAPQELTGEPVDAGAPK